MPGRELVLAAPEQLAGTLCRGVSTTDHARQQEDLTLLVQRLVPAVAEDHAIDGDGDTARELRLKAGIGLA